MCEIRRFTTAVVLGLVPIVLAVSTWAGDTPRKTWDFERDAPGKIAAGFTNEVGRWEVIVEEGKHSLAQKAENENRVFNVALVEGFNLKDLDISVKLRPIAGKLDRGGGLVWRALDARNYYVARYNPLEENFRLYKVQDGKRTQFADARIPGDAGWHTLRVTMKGPRMTCYLDGTRYLEAEDSTFSEAGTIGLWSKADAQTQFDDLTASSQ